MNYEKELSIAIAKLTSTRNTLTGMETVMSEDPEASDLGFSIVRCCNSMVNEIDDLLCQLRAEVKTKE